MPTAPPFSERTDDGMLVIGAGRVGGWIAGHLAAAGMPVTLVGRERTIDPIRLHGLLLTRGSRQDAQAAATTLEVAPHALGLVDAVPPGIRPALALVCVKSPSIEALAEPLARLSAGTPIVVLTRGLQAVATLRAALPSHGVFDGGFIQRVDERSPAHLHAAGPTPLHVGARAAPWGRWSGALAAAGLPLRQHSRMLGWHWRMVQQSLHLAPLALTGAVTPETIRARWCDPDWLACLAALHRETRTVLRAAGIARGPLAGRRSGWPELAPWLLRVGWEGPRRPPPAACPNLQEDLQRGRPTEVDTVHGEVVRQAARLGQPAPINGRTLELVQSWTRLARPFEPRTLRLALGVAGPDSS